MNVMSFAQSQGTRWQSWSQTEVWLQTQNYLSTLFCHEPVEKQKKQEQPVEEVLEELQAKLTWTQGELEAQREAERQRQLQVGTQEAGRLRPLAA